MGDKGGATTGVVELTVGGELPVPLTTTGATYKREKNTVASHKLSIVTLNRQNNTWEKINDNSQSKFTVILNALISCHCNSSEV